jgi:hypothetical protein
MRIALSCHVNPDDANAFYNLYAAKGTTVVSVDADIPIALPQELIEEVAEQLPPDGKRRWFILLAEDFIAATKTEKGGQG